MVRTSSCRSTSHPRWLTPHDRCCARGARIARPSAHRGAGDARGRLGRRRPRVCSALGVRTERSINAGRGLGRRSRPPGFGRTRPIYRFADPERRTSRDPASRHALDGRPIFSSRTSTRISRVDGTITGTWKGTSVQASTTLTPHPKPTSITLDPAIVQGGTGSFGRVTAEDPRNEDVTFTLSSSRPDIVITDNAAASTSTRGRSRPAPWSISRSPVAA